MPKINYLWDIAMRNYERNGPSILESIRMNSVIHRPQRRNRGSANSNGLENILTRILGDSPMEEISSPPNLLSGPSGPIASISLPNIPLNLSTRNGIDQATSNEVTAPNNPIQIPEATTNNENTEAQNPVSL